MNKPLNFFMDAGNRGFKMLVPDGRGDKRMKPHYSHNALAHLSQSDWMRITSSDDNLPEHGYYIINGQPYAIGDKARRNNTVELPRGAQRYNKQFYGVLGAFGVYEYLARRKTRKTNDVPEIAVWCMYPPQDAIYKKFLRESLMGRWSVYGHVGEIVFDVTQVFAIDEPIGGTSHYLLNTDGKVKNRNLFDKTFLTIDVGGFTTDVSPIDSGFAIDRTAMNSVQLGVLDLYRNFETDLRLKYDKLRVVKTFDPKQIENALITGQFTYGKNALDCADIAHENLNIITNDVLEIIDSVGGVFSYYAIVLTGGGGYVISNHLQNHPRINGEIDVILADSKPEQVVFANLNGLYKSKKSAELSR